jgi:hypothetical protein
MTTVRAHHIYRFMVTASHSNFKRGHDSFEDAYVDACRLARYFGVAKIVALLGPTVTLTRRADGTIAQTGMLGY